MRWNHLSPSQWKTTSSIRASSIGSVGRDSWCCESGRHSPGNGYFPTPGKVKLNRVALKDVIGLRLGPRRRRVPKPLKNVTTDSNKHVVCDTSSNEPVQSILTEQMTPENVPETAGRDPGETCAAGTLQSKRRNNIQSCKRKNMELKQQGTITRGKYEQRKPTTRSKSRLDTVTLRFRFTWCFCAESKSASVKHTKVQIPQKCLVK
ncbi:hypothetical protein PAMP_007808 [Pampus punctatissimus]